MYNVIALHSIYYIWVGFTVLIHPPNFGLKSVFHISGYKIWCSYHNVRSSSLSHYLIFIDIGKATIQYSPSNHAMIFIDL